MVSVRLGSTIVKTNSPLRAMSRSCCGAVLIIMNWRSLSAVQ